MRSFMRGRRPQSRPLEILCEDHIGKYVIPFLCRWRMAEAKTDRSIETAVIGWREAK